MGRGEKGEGVDEGLLRNLEKAVDASAGGAEAVEADEAVEEARLEDGSRRLTPLDPSLLEDEDVGPEEVEKAELLPRLHQRL